MGLGSNTDAGVVYFLISRRFGDRDAPRRPLSTLTEDDADLRGRFKDTVFVDKVDLRQQTAGCYRSRRVIIYVLAGRSSVVPYNLYFRKLTS